MAIQILERNDPRFPQGGPDPESDQLARQKAMIRARQDERDVFKTETVQITFGPKKDKQDVVLKWPSSARIVETHDDLGNVVHRERVYTGGRFIFAVYAENQHWHTVSRDEWEAAATNAIEKFAAAKGVSIIMGPKQEDMNRYNIMAETRENLS